MEAGGRGSARVRPGIVVVLSVAVLCAAVPWTPAGAEEVGPSAGVVPASDDPESDPRPNLIIVMTDDQRADTLWAMPTLQEELVAKGVTFTNAMVPNPLCCPSRVSFLTGQYSHNNGVWTNSKPYGGAAAFQFGQHNTLATWLQSAGYATILAGKYLNGYGPFKQHVPPGWSDWLAIAGPSANIYFGTHYSDNGDAVISPEDVYSTTTIGDRVAGFIRGTPVDRPVFAYMATSAAHDPFLAEEQYLHTFDDLEPHRPPNYDESGMKEHHKPRWLRRMPRITEEREIALDKRAKAQLGTLRSVDDALAEVLAALEETGRLGNTMIVYTADNGFFWGEHRLTDKSAPYTDALHVPLVVRYDPVTAAAASESSSIVLNLDIAPTFAALGKALPLRKVDGRSLLPLLEGRAHRLRKRFVVESMAYQQRFGKVPAYCGARSGRFLYVRWHRGEEELIDYRTDPWELRNVAGAPSMRQRLVGLRRYAKETCLPRPPGFRWGRTRMP